MTIAERQELKTGTSLSLDGRKCMILGVMGAGSSCIAYKAQMKLTIEGKTASRTIVLKELYPTHQNIIRGKDNSLIIPSSSKAVFEEESESFVKAAILQFEFHNEEDLTNFTSDIEVIYQLNNTLYSVTGIVSGKAYDKINPENITSILKVGESLSHAISYYHGKDYLNLDIKPSNIFYENLPGDNVAIKLFDFNTVCTKEEAVQGKFSYSEGYAAPEVKAAKKGGGKLSEIGEQADIYSIGTVIFEKIMGRIPKVADQRAGKRWKLEINPYLKGAVPQLQNGITELFRKTLAIDKKDRYSSVKELIIALEKLVKLAGIEVFLKNQKISPCTPKDIFISRKDVLFKIATRIDEQHVLFLHGIGGIGKSETARQYAKEYNDKYHFIQSVFYFGSLKKTIANLDFVGLKDEDRFAHTDEDIDRLYNYKYGLLGNTAVYGTNTLLIIDNYDYNVDPTSEEYQQNYKIIRELKKLNIHILFTTRVNPDDDTECLDLENMSEKELKALFFRINPKDKDKPERMELVKEIIKVSYKHTMTVKLIAMQSAKYLKPLSKYLDILKTSGLNSGIKSRVTNEKDDESVTMSTVYDHIQALFDFDDLNDKQKYIMVNACLLPLSGLEANIFSKYIDLEHFDGASDSDCIDESIEDLVNSGWIEYADTSERMFTAETKITLHPLICDIVKNELNPELTEDKCRKFYVSFLDLIQEWGSTKLKRNFHFKDEKLIYQLYFKLSSFFYCEQIAKAINFILLHNYEKDKNYNTDNYSIISNENLLLYFGIEKKYIIDENINKIGDAAFKDCFFLEELIIPDSVTHIGVQAIRDCNHFRKVKLSSKLEYIDMCAFYGCSSLLQIIIPDTIKYIGSYAFYGCSNLKNISIPDGISCIEKYTFSGCSSLVQIHIPDSITEIQANAFSRCSSLIEINIPNSVTEIGGNTFFDCSSLKQVHLPNNMNTIKASTFYRCISLNQINIPDKIKHIEHSAFEDCSSLSYIVIPTNITDIGYRAFFGCSSLVEINIPDCVEYIEGEAFSWCTALKNINIPNGIRYIKYKTFDHCSSLTKVTFSEGNIGIETKAFNNCISLKQINIPNSIEYVSEDSFLGCTSLSETIIQKIKQLSDPLLMIIPDGTTFIKNKEFVNRKLTKVILPDGLIYINDSAFENCSSLSQINIPDSVEYIGKSSFEGCSSLTKIYIPDTVKHIDKRAFAYCSSLKTISLPNNVTHIAEGVFSCCRSLSNIKLPKGIINIGNNAFSGCSSLIFIDIANGVTSLEDEAFLGCNSLKKITIPNSITQINSGLFMYCQSLTEITLSQNTIEIGNNAFYCCELLNHINLPNTVTHIRIGAFWNCYNMSYIILPSSLTVIEDSAFRKCLSLTQVIIPENVNYIGSGAFFDCKSLVKVTVLNARTKILKMSFGFYKVGAMYRKIENLTIEGYKGSTAEQYAKEHGFQFVSLE